MIVNRKRLILFVRRKMLRMPRNKRGFCGAKTRVGTPCKAPPVWDKVHDIPRNGRCKLHGGLSTGAKTEAGKEAIRISNKARSGFLKKKAGSI